MSTLKVNAISNVAGTGSPNITEQCKAWVNFNGTSTVAIRGDFNVSSITDNGTGSYTVNFTTAMSSSNYACGGYASTNNVVNGFVLGPGSTGRTTTSVTVVGFTGSAVYDPLAVNVIVFD